VPQSKQSLFVGSTTAYSGKSAIILGIARQLQEKGIDISYGKPVGLVSDATQSPPLDEDVMFISQVLKLPPERLSPTLISLDPTSVARRIRGENTQDYQAAFSQYIGAAEGDFFLLEGPSNFAEGKLFNLSMLEMVHLIDAPVLLVARFHLTTLTDALLVAKQQLGDRLCGVVINDIPDSHIEEVKSVLKPFLESQGIDVLGLLPHSDLLRSVSVGELVQRLGAEVLCCPDRMDLMVEGLTIGAMNVNSALKYFRKGHNMAVVTGGDRTDLQFAALETSTQCLILTGHLPPDSIILSRAEELEVPILSVDLDTLTTVEIIERSFREVELHEAIKVQCVFELMEQYFDLEKLLTKLNWTAAET
jgi:BioD-like phosphotransacetylase family protein